MKHPRGASLFFYVLMPLLLGLSPLQDSQAASITYNFEGYVTGIAGAFFELPSPFSASVGQPITGSLTYETNTVDIASSDPVYGNYIGPITNVSISLGSYVGIGDQYNNSRMEIWNNLPFGPSTLDQLTVSSHATGPTFNETALSNIALLLSDGSGLALGGDVLGPIPPLGTFSNNNDIFLQFSGLYRTSLQGQLTSLTSVPLPGAAVLFPTGLTLLATAFRRLRGRKSKTGSC